MKVGNDFEGAKSERGKLERGKSERVESYFRRGKLEGGDRGLF